MPRNTIYYSQKNHSVYLTENNGSSTVFLTDFAPDNCISWEYINETKIEPTEGFDSSRLSVASTRAGKITVILKPTSPSIDRLVKYCDEYKRGLITMFDVVITTGVDETIVLKRAAVQESGARETGGPTMQNRTFVFIGEELQESNED